MTLWSGRFTEDPHEDLMAFTADRSDRRLLHDDLLGSAAHARMLREVGLLSDEETHQLVEAIGDLLEEAHEGRFDFDDADTVYTVYAFRPLPMALDLAEDFGLPDDEVDAISEQLSELGIDGLDPLAIDPSILPKLDFEEFLQALPVLLKVFGVELGDLERMLPPDVLQELRDLGVFGEEEGQS